MLEKLRIKDIYDDFIYKFTLTDEEAKVLNMLIKRYTIPKIAMELYISEPKVSVIIKKLKKYYKQYEELERLKIKIFNI